MALRLCGDEDAIAQQVTTRFFLKKLRYVDGEQEESGFFGGLMCYLFFEGAGRFFQALAAYLSARGE